MRGAVLALFVFGACIQAQTVPCGDLLCPVGNVCTEGGCATDESAGACNGKADGESCMFGDVHDGVCAGGACRAMICGDGIRVGIEACDDGNTSPGDDCSAACDSTEVCGNGVVDSVNNEQCDDGLAGLSGDGCASSCQVEFPAWSDVSPRPISARGGTAIAYDPTRDRVVLFGGYSTLSPLDDTWEWANGSWVRRKPIESPPARANHTITYDPDHKVTVMFGGAGANGPLADTWTWDGVIWKNVTPAVSPPARSGHQMVWDRARKRGVLVGGSGALANFGDTWEWDGTTWTQRSDVMSPGIVTHHYLAYDTLRGVTVLYGGSDARLTWEYEGTKWTNIPVAPPTMSNGGAMTYDEFARVCVLFGGNIGNTRTNETWTWNGTAWAKYSGVTQPPAIRTDVALAYFSSKQHVLMFGGHDFTATSNLLLADTWTFTSSSGWVMMAQPAIAPSPRGFTSMAYDPLTGSALLFAGQNPNTTTFHHDLWEWRDGSWTLRSPMPAGSPPDRSDAAVTFDIARERLVVFGGFAGGSNWLDDTFEWDRATWLKRTPTTKPGARSSAAIGYDVKRGQTILFGGRLQSSIDDNTWSWDGTEWTMLSPATRPPPRYASSMAYDPIRERLVLFGGFSGSAALADTWEWDGQTWIEGPSMPAAARSTHGLVYDASLRAIIAYGGYEHGLRSDTWKYDGTAWTEVLAPPLSVPPRAVFAIGYDAIDRQVIAFGGRSYSGEFLADTVAFEYTSPFQAKERCAVADDDFDSDGLHGCDDPDCWGRCTPLCPPGAACAADAPRCGDGVCSVIEDPLICPGDCP